MTPTRDQSSLFKMNWTAFFIAGMAMSSAMIPSMCDAFIIGHGRHKHHHASTKTKDSCRTTAMHVQTSFSNTRDKTNNDMNILSGKVGTRRSYGHQNEMNDNKMVASINTKDVIFLAVKNTASTYAAVIMIMIACSMTPILSTPASARITGTTTTTMPMIGNVNNNALIPTSILSMALGPAGYTGELIDTTNAIVVKLDSGVTYRDLRDGSGSDVAVEGNRVNIQWVLKRNNGYSIDSSSEHDGVPFIFVIGSAGSGKQRAIPGLDEGIRGMKVGGIRRIVIPPSQAYVGGLDDTNSPGPVPVDFGPKQRIRRVMENRIDVPDESFLLDVKLTRVQ